LNRAAGCKRLEIRPQAVISTRWQKNSIFTDDAGESLEIYYARQRFLEAGYRPLIASTQRKLLHGVIHDFEPVGILTWSGRATEFNPTSASPLGRVSGQGLRRLAAHRWARAGIFSAQPEGHSHHAGVSSAREKWIFSICHRHPDMIAAGLTQGKTLNCYRNVRSELELGGGRWGG